MKEILLNYFHIIKCAGCKKWKRFFNDRWADYNLKHPNCYLCKECSEIADKVYNRIIRKDAQITLTEEEKQNLAKHWGI